MKKMTYEDAKNWLFKKCEKAQDECGCCLESEQCKNCEIELATKAVFNAMPLEPIAENGKMTCGCCGCVVESENNQFNYCPNCGQKVEWKGKRIMKEMTRVITAEITVIETMPDDEADAVQTYKPDAAEALKKELQKMFMSNTDDIHVTIQDFELDKPERA